jgi:putative FmdB family regulatory protein
MDLLDTVKSMLGSEDEERVFKYRCENCDAVFEDESPSASRVDCPECGAHRAISLPSTPA